MPSRRADDLDTASVAALLGLPFAELDPQAQRVARHIGGRMPITRHPETVQGSSPTRGQRAVDAATAFGGSRLSVGFFAAIVLLWVASNVVLMPIREQTFDLYLFILLNLFLWMLLAVRPPRHPDVAHRRSEKDRLTAAHDYKVNVKAELEIMLLHDKRDQLRQAQWAELLRLQTKQMRLLAALVAALASTCASALTPPLQSEQHVTVAGPADQDRRIGSGLPHVRCGRWRRHALTQDQP